MEILFQTISRIYLMKFYEIFEQYKTQIYSSITNFYFSGIWDDICKYVD